MYKTKPKPNSQEIRVAIAAPCIPMAGTGPKPKIKMGSSTALISPALPIIILGVLVSPEARKTALPIIGPIKQTLPIYQISIY